MSYFKLKTWLLNNNLTLPVIISIILVIIGNSFFLQRGQDSVYASEHLKFTIDNTIYFSMVQGDYQHIYLPFKYRILVPFLASCLPLSPSLALKIISVISLAICYLFTLLSCRKLGYDNFQSMIGLFVSYATTSHLLNYQNLYMTDAFQLMIIALIFFSLVSNNFWLFLFSIILGILARETTIILAPAWLLIRENRKGLMILFLSFFIFITIRFLFSSSQDTNIFNNLYNAFESHGSKISYIYIIQLSLIHI